jgi:hypothetical protein
MNSNNSSFFIKPLKYYPPPPFINSTLVYQDINKDENLRELMTHFFLKKSIKWLSSYDDFKESKKSLSKLKSNEGYNIIYNILREYCRKNNINWYDLKKSYNKIKDYLRYKLAKL